MFPSGSGNGSYAALGVTTLRVSFSRKDNSTELVILRGSAGSHSRYVLLFVLLHTRCSFLARGRHLVERKSLSYVLELEGISPMHV